MPRSPRSETRRNEIADLLAGVPDEVLIKARALLRARSQRKRPDALDFETWAAKYLPHYFYAPFPQFAIEHARILSDARPGMRFAFAEPRGHGKTTRWSIAFPLYAMAELGYRFVVLIGPTATAAEDNVRSIEAEIEANEAIREDYPHLQPMITSSGQPKKWTDKDQIYASGQRVSARGIFSSFRGFNERGNRPDLIIIDDVEKDDLVLTENGRAKLLNRFRRAVMGLQGAKGMVLFVVGNLLHPDGLLSKLTGNDEFPTFHKHRVRAIIDYDKKTIAYPELWTFDALDRIRREDMGSAAFQIEYQNEPGLALGDFFNRDKSWYFDRSKIDPVGWTRLAFIDPAIGETNRHCYTSIAAGLVSPAGRLYVIDWITDRMNPSRMAEEIEALHSRWNFTRIGFEVAGQQAAFLEVFKLKGLGRLPFVRISARSPKTTADRKGRIDLLEIPVGTGEIRFCDDWQSREYYRIGMQQLFAYAGPESRDFIDAPDALAGLWGMAKRSRPTRRKKSNRPDPKAAHRSFLLE